MAAKRSSRRGGSAVEFALLSVVWVPLLLGSWATGMTMIRSLQSDQIARDAGHMYARGVDFSLSGTQAMLGELSSDMGTLTSTGTGEVILSTISYIGRYQCKALGLADNADPPNPSAACTNYGHWVFTHRFTIGNSSLATSHFGSPDASLVTQSTGYIARDVYTKNVLARADTFTLLPKPKEDGADGFQAGQFAYLVETYFKVPQFPGVMTGQHAYAYAMF